MPTCHVRQRCLAYSRRPNDFPNGSTGNPTVSGILSADKRVIEALGRRPQTRLLFALQNRLCDRDAQRAHCEMGLVVLTCPVRQHASRGVGIRTDVRNLIRTAQGN